MSAIIGIDPGQTGAICILGDDPKRVEIHDMPILTIGKKHVIDHYAIARIIDAEAKSGPVVWIEYVAASPQMGVTSAFNFGEGFGVLLGVCAANFLPIHTVTPPKWKAAMGARGEKDESRARASALLPHASHYFGRVKDHGRADAALIALYGASRIRVVA